MKGKIDFQKLKNDGYKLSLIGKNDGSKACIFCGKTEDIEQEVVQVDDKEKQIAVCNICRICFAELKLSADARARPIQDIVELKIDNIIKQLHLEESDFLR